MKLYWIILFALLTSCKVYRVTYKNEISNGSYCGCEYTIYKYGNPVLIFEDCDKLNVPSRMSKKEYDKFIVESNRCN